MSDERLISIDRIWARVRGRLRQEFGESTYRSWIRSLVLEEVIGERVTLAAPTLFMRDRIVSQYGDRITLAWAAESADTVNDCLITVRSSDEPVIEAVTGDSKVTKNSLPLEPKVIGTKAKKENSLEGSLDSRFTFDNFVVGKPNELAYAAAQRVSGSDEVLFNPLFLYGAVGLGKTHLMHSIAWDIRRRDPSRRVLYLSAEKFMYQFIRALRFKDTMAFKDQFRSVDVLMIDDVQFIGGKDSTQEEFFHTFNALVDQNRQVIISADKSPTDLEGLEERLRSRLGWGLVADIHPTTYELRLGILQSKVEKLGVAVPTKVLEFLAHKITSNVRELEGAMNRIAAHATLVGRDITLEATQEVLHDLLRSYERRVTIEEIQRQVASHYQIRVGDMHSPRRSRSIARPRQIAMFLAKQLTQHSLPDIGRRFGGRDHTTVLHAVKKVDELCIIDKQFQDDVEFLRRMLET
jgi:chromosomal replication initiator protein|tara:strand:- start:13657 stop:15051 length:1395 start_codon:yes stop_codon:yes gene_type:complete